MKKVAAVLLLMSAALLAQDELVTVPKKYVSSEGMQHQDNAEKISQYIGIGHEIGIATKEGLESVVDVSQKFGGTNVGRFVMFMVAWKIIGRELIGIVVGIPIWAIGVCLWMYSMRRFFWGVRVLSKVNADKSKEYIIQPPYKFSSDDAKGFAGSAHLLVITGWSIALLCVIL